jgi:hypothetical protein
MSSHLVWARKTPLQNKRKRREDDKTQAHILGGSAIDRSKEHRERHQLVTVVAE